MLNDKIIKRYIKLGQLEKSIGEERKRIRGLIIEATGYLSDKYMANVTHSSKTLLESVKFIRELAPRMFEKLRDMGCVKQIDVTTVTIKELETLNSKSLDELF